MFDSSLGLVIVDMRWCNTADAMSSDEVARNYVDVLERKELQPIRNDWPYARLKGGCPSADPASVFPII